MQASDDQRSQRDYGDLAQSSSEQVDEYEKGMYVTLKGRSVNKSETGTWKAAPFVYGTTLDQLNFPSFPFVNSAEILFSKLISIEHERCLRKISEREGRK